jgi:cysteine desulfurase/selenocysteine lyase
MLDVRHLFPGSANGIYLNTASMALGNAPAADALERAITEWIEGRFSWREAEASGEAAREVAARLLGVASRDVALTAGASGGAATVAAQLPDARSGENVVVPARDFTSNFVPWALLGERGFEVRTVEDASGALPLDAFAELVDQRTAVIASSLVQSVSGYRVDVDGLKQLAAEHGAWLVLDASQSFGAEPVLVDGISALFSCSHKWSLGTRGVGYLYVDPAVGAGFRPVMPGWKALRDPLTSFYGPDFELLPTTARLDVSWPWFNPIADLEGLRILDSIGIDAIASHNRTLVDALEAGGATIPFPRGARSSIISLDVRDPERAMAQIDGRGVVASLRGGRLRISFHLYNTLEDVEAVLQVVK